jgi:hypothetical protein
LGLNHTIADMKTIAKKRPQFQLNSTLLDSANTVLLKIYKDALAGKKRPSMENRTRTSGS